MSVPYTTLGKIFYKSLCGNKGKINKCRTIGTVPKSNRKPVERGKMDTPNTIIYDRPLSWFGKGTSTKSGG